MLDILVPHLVCPICKDSAAQLKASAFARNGNGRIGEGALACPSCGAWFPISEHVLELLPAALIHPDTVAKFAGVHADALAAAGLEQARMGGGMAGGDGDFTEQLTQRQHFDWYADHPEADYADYAEMPFWKAADAVTLASWSRLLPRQGLILDVGCANGRSAFPLIGAGRVVVGFDISRAMVRKAIQRAEREGVADRAAFLVADGSLLPFKSDTFDCAQTYGVLHHLPDPGGVVGEILRVLKPGGVFLGSENNETAFRVVFDWMMRLLPIWHEEAGEEPLISHAMLDDWTRGRAVYKNVSTSVFLPPHLFNMIGTDLAKAVLAATDRLFSAVPWIGRNGGLIVFEMIKLSPADAH